MTQTTTNPVTGQVYEPEQEESKELGMRDMVRDMIEPLRTSMFLPIHEQFLAQIEPAELREELANVYYGMEPRSLKEFAGQDIPVYGMIIYEQGPFEENNSAKSINPGFFQARILTKDMRAKGEPFVTLKSSSVGVNCHVLNIVKNRGWFLFDSNEPIIYRVSVSADNRHYLYNVSHNLGKRLAERAGKK